MLVPFLDAPVLLHHHAHTILNPLVEEHTPLAPIPNRLDQLVPPGGTPTKGSHKAGSSGDDYLLPPGGRTDEGITGHGDYNRMVKGMGLERERGSKSERAQAHRLNAALSATSISSTTSSEQSLHAQKTIDESHKANPVSSALSLK